MKTYKVHHDYTAKENSIIDKINIGNFVDIRKYPLKNAWINIGGWQSWNPAFEIELEKKQPSLVCHFIKGWNQYLVFPESQNTPSKNIVLGQFVCYLRWDDFYLVFVSAGNIKRTLPPVQFIFDRKQNTVSIEICDKGNEWKTGDITAEIEIFTANSFFDCKEKLSDIFGKNHFDKIKSLGKNPGGWESWYNHYSNIDAKLIEEDLEKLYATKNIITQESYSSIVFQIDDGWEKALGDWDYSRERFPEGFTRINEQIESKGYIPGLWIAPFIIDARSKTATEHPDWILKNEKGKNVLAGYNPLWGQNGNFYCLDLSRDDVISYLDDVMVNIIENWGFRYIKLDFLYAGMLYGNYTNKTASYKIYTRAIKMLTARTKNKNGQAVTYLGCGLPFELSFKYLPLSRIGCDTYEHWENKKVRMINWNGRNEAYLNLKDSLGHALWNKIIFANDPDVIFIRSENCSLTENEKLLIAGINTMFGSQLMYSDDPGRAGDAENQLTSKIIELRKKLQGKDFGLKNIGFDTYEFSSKNGELKGSIDLGKSRRFEIYEKE